MTAMTDKTEKVIRTAVKRLNGFILKYTLYKCAVPADDENEKRVCYSIKIEKAHSNCNDVSYARDITSDISKANAVFDMLTENNVTPVSLWDVIEDKLY